MHAPEHYVALSNPLGPPNTEASFSGYSLPHPGSVQDYSQNDYPTFEAPAPTKDNSDINAVMQGLVTDDEVRVTPQPTQFVDDRFSDRPPTSGHTHLESYGTETPVVNTTTSFDRHNDHPNSFIPNPSAFDPFPDNGFAPSNTFMSDPFFNVPVAEKEQGDRIGVPKGPSAPAFTFSLAQLVQAQLFSLEPLLQTLDPRIRMELEVVHGQIIRLCEQSGVGSSLEATYAADEEQYMDMEVEEQFAETEPELFSIEPVEEQEDWWNSMEVASFSRTASIQSGSHLMQRRSVDRRSVSRESLGADDGSVVGNLFQLDGNCFVDTILRTSF
ncbi:hypothetical protein MPER_09167 [Moniliophthora perniciosa FA553]|nr:hypothetical protein MPER_09167 [Moniliophthora perniciosa FA553]